MRLPNHLFIASSDGAIYDTRQVEWHKKPALRANYSQSHSDINSLADLKACLRNGQYAWPGGYPLYFITSDGAALSFATVREEWRLCAQAWLDEASARSGWRVVACDINYEDGELICDHSGKRIESAYCEKDS